MKQISKRITYLFSLRRKKIFDVLKKYNMKEHEYYLLLELSINKDMSFDELLQIQNIEKDVFYDTIQSLKDKGFITVEDHHFSITDQFCKVKELINHDLKKIDDDFSKTMDYKKYNEYIRVLDELIDYYEEQNYKE